MDPTCGLDVEKKNLLPQLRLIPRSVSLITVLTMLSQSPVFLVSQYGNINPHLKALVYQPGVYLFTTATRMVLWLAQDPVQWEHRVALLGVKHSGYEDDISVWLQLINDFKPLLPLYS